jgi:tRNA(Ile)-lysidine synthase
MAGLAGIPQRRSIREGSDVEIVRPLLAVRRDDLRGYLTQKKLTWMDDATNDDVSAATRNRIRHDLLPSIAKHINPEIVPALVRLAEQADRSSRALKQLATEALDRISLDSPADELLLSASALAALPRGLQTEVVVVLLTRLGVGRKHVGFERIEAVASLADGVAQSSRIEIAGGWCVERRGDRLRFAKDPAPPSSQIASSAFSE